jgi:DNA polymerase-2
VFSGGAGLFEDVAVLDFKSLYPTIIRTFHIDPYSLIKAAEHPLDTPAGIKFSRSEHILPAYLGELMTRRARARSDSDAPLAQAVKILMNSMYGVMGSTGCRFYRSELPTAITGIGRWVLDTTTERLEAWGYRVLYGDTDSVFVKLKTEERQNADTAGGTLAARVDQYFREMILKKYGVPSLLELQYEKRYLRLFLPQMRTGAGDAAVKRYAGLLSDSTLEIKGMEFVRSDSTPLARDFQYELFRRFFAGEDLKVWIRGMVERLRSGEFDDKLVYRRRLTRPARDYRSPPPHVRVAMMLDPDGSADLREVAYVMTPAGPVPVEHSPREIDYNHYIDKQLRSLADDVLALQGESFDAVVGGRQLDLF